jgi:hypothetical protein
MGMVFGDIVAYSLPYQKMSSACQYLLPFSRGVIRCRHEDHTTFVNLTLLMSSIKYLRWLSRRVKFPPPGVSRVQEQIETKFQRLPRDFGVELLNDANADIVVQPEIHDGGSETEVPVPRAVFGTNKISKVIIILSGTTNARKCKVARGALLTTLRVQHGSPTQLNVDRHRIPDAFR